LFEAGSYRLFNFLCRVFPMKLEDGNELSQATTFGPTFPQVLQQFFIHWRPGFPPASDWNGMLEGARALREQS
jgi:hypothetical protein